MSGFNLNLFLVALFWINLVGYYYVVSGDRDVIKAMLKLPVTAANSGKGVTKAFALDLFIASESMATNAQSDIITVNFSTYLPKLHDGLTQLFRKELEASIGAKKKATFDNLMYVCFMQ